MANKLVIDGEVCFGSTDSAENIICTDKDGNSSNVQIELDNFNHSLNQSWINNSDVHIEIENAITKHGIYSTFMLAFGTNNTNSPKEWEWWVLEYKCARILAWKNDDLATMARNGKDAYTDWKYYCSEEKLSNIKESILSYLFYQNKWRWERVALCNNTLEAFNNSTVIESRFFNDAEINYTLDFGENYTAKATTYIYSDINKSFSCSLTTDDAGALFVNGVASGTIASCVASTVTISLKPGWNTIEVIYTENGGKDGWFFSPTLSSNASVLVMSAVPYDVSEIS